MIRYEVHRNAHNLRWTVVRTGSRGGITKVVEYGTTPEDQEVAGKLAFMMSEYAHLERGGS